LRSGEVFVEKEMRPICKVADQSLEWRQLHPFGREFELRTRFGEVVVARLRGPILGLSAEAESTDGKWTFSPAGILGGVKIRIFGSESEDPRFCQDRKGVWVLGGHRYMWRVSCWATEIGEPLVHFRSQLAFLTKEYKVLIEPRAVLNPDLSLLTLLGLYLLILQSLPDAGEGLF
jgi:hypothetical protein